MLSPTSFSLAVSKAIEHCVSEREKHKVSQATKEGVSFITQRDLCHLTVIIIFVKVVILSLIIPVPTYVRHPLSGFKRSKFLTVLLIKC